MSTPRSKKKGSKGDGDKAVATNGQTSPVPANTLVICRNKHWKYISSFHGPWLQLPPEVLESLAYSNYYAPRPRPIDPAVFFDLVKIRKLVDDATNLAVRAASGVASSSFNNNYAANNILGRGGAEVLGLGIGGGGTTARLSRERKHRMRELATQKLSKAYTLDEIAASVATMQSASTLEEVASLVLGRSPNDPDAKYVHFFHEKIPSRMLAKCTSLKLLDDVFAERPGEGAVLRTKAITKGFKEDWKGAIADLTSALSIVRMKNAHHPAVQPQGRRGSSYNGKLDDDDQPSSLEPQLLFHRACSYLTVACSHIEGALGKPNYAQASSPTDPETRPGTPASSSTAPDQDPVAKDAARKSLRLNAKRAIRDYLKFLSHFEYCSGGPLPEEPRPSKTPTTPVDPSTAVITPPATPPHPPIHDIATLFTASPTPLPPTPSPHESLTYHPLLTDALHSLLLSHTLLQTPTAELRRYAHIVARLARICDGYPIFLAARSPARADWIEILRGVNGSTAAGAAPAESWLGLTDSWEALCQPAPLAGGAADLLASMNAPAANVPLLRDAPANPRRRIAAASGTERDQALALSTLQQPPSLPGRTGSQGQGGGGGGGGGGMLESAAQRQVLRRWAQEDGREYPVSGERAGWIVRWVLEAGTASGGVGGGGAAGAGGGGGGRKKKKALVDGSASVGEAEPETPVTPSTPFAREELNGTAAE